MLKHTLKKSRITLKSLKLVKGSAVVEGDYTSRSHHHDMKTAFIQGFFVCVVG